MPAASSSADRPRYPVYLSPDGTREQVAATPAREVQLKHAGWRLVSRPRTPTPEPASDAGGGAAGKPGSDVE